jgi:hypothetical protein
MESIIQISNGKKGILRGILHVPEALKEKTRKDLVVFPNGGVMGCEGDFRAYTNMSRILVHEGFYVLRVSPSGMGYSDGFIADCRQKNLFNQIENGLLVEDIITAVKYAKSIDEFTSITLAGICGGAISVFLAAATLEEVQYIIPIGIPAILDKDDLDYNARLPANEAKMVVQMYSHKIFSFKAWIRLLSKQSDWGRIKTAIRTLFRGKPAYISEDDDGSKFSSNPCFFEAAQIIFKTKKKVLFIFGDADGFWWEFEKLFLKKFYDGADPLPFEYYLAPRVNHMLTFPEMQTDVVSAMINWLRKHLG